MAGIRVAGLSGQVAQGVEGRGLYQLTIGRINKFYGVCPYIVEPALHLIDRFIDLRGGCLRCPVCSRSAGYALQVRANVTYKTDSMWLRTCIEQGHAGNIRDGAILRRNRRAGWYMLQIRYDAGVSIEVIQQVENLLPDTG